MPTTDNTNSRSETPFSDTDAPDSPTKEGPTDYLEHTGSEESSEDPEQLTTDAPREYIQVTPTDTALQPHSAPAQFKRLHRLTTEDDDHGLLGRLRTLSASKPAPTVECLLLADGSDKRPLTYWFGVDEPSATSALEDILRGVFPDSYELERVEMEAGRLESIIRGEPLHEESESKEASDEATLTAIEFLGEPVRPRDWQTQLTPFDHFQTDDHARIPLASVVETMTAHPGPIAYQALLAPKPDWSTEAEERVLDIEAHSDTMGDQVVNTLFGPPDPETDVSLPASDEARLEELRAKDTRHSFVVNARIVASTPANDPDADTTVRTLETALSQLNRTTYEIEGRCGNDTRAEVCLNDLLERRVYQPDHGTLRARLPWHSRASRGIVADVHEAPSFCLVDGPALTAAGSRALAQTPGERSALPRPPAEQLAQYQGDGFALGHPLTQDGTADDSPLALPPSLQPLHVAVFGKTGSGKSSVINTGILENHAATDGADILIDRKGDGMGLEYLRAHYATYGTLKNVYYFDCAETLPALSFFDITDQLDAGISRTAAVEDIVDHYIEILEGIMGRDRFEQAVRSPDIIRYLLKAQFDPVHGQDAFSHGTFQEAAAHMRSSQDAPPVSDPELQAMLGGVVTNSQRSFDKLMQGVANRIEKIPIDDRLGQLFNHVSTDESDAGDAPGETRQFDFREIIDEDAVVIFDLGGLRSESQRALSLVLLSQLWTALRRRTLEETGESIRARSHAERSTSSSDDPVADTTHDSGGETALPLVNLYIEEAASVASSSLLSELLAQSRAFGLSVTLAMQFPAQLRSATGDAYAEILNNISTIVTGNVAVDRDLATRIATTDMDPATVGARLRAIQRGQWLVSLPAQFNAPEPRPFMIESMPLPAGHPEGPDPLSGSTAVAFEGAVDVCLDRTRLTSGLDVSTPPTHSTERSSDTSTTEATASRIDSALPLTSRFPSVIEYDEHANAVICGACDARYEPTAVGVRHAIGCCHTLDDVDRNDVPVADVHLMLSQAERQRSSYTDRQLAFLQICYNAHQQQYDPDLEYDIRRDSMVRLQEYAGVDTEAVEQLLDDGLLREDCTHPHKLLTVASEGRSELQIGHKEGVAHGHGKGDLSESSLHVAMVILGRDYIEAAFVQNPASEATEAVVYHEVDGHRLDAAGLDENGEVVVTLEAERLNNDRHTAVPSDFDKMAALDPEESIWIVPTRDDAHDILEILNDPLEGEPRVEKTYSRNSPPQAFTIDEPGLSEIYTLRYVRDSLLG